VETLGTDIKQVRKSPGSCHEQFPEQISTIQSYVFDSERNKATSSEELIKATSYRWGCSRLWIWRNGLVGTRSLGS
jgi:hypothetical protein